MWPSEASEWRGRREPAASDGVARRTQDRQWKLPNLRGHPELIDAKASNLASRVNVAASGASAREERVLR
jgi:hypothetical protein